MARKKANPFLDEDLWRRFKATCALLDTQPSTVLETLIRQWLTEHDADARARLEGTHA
jgi:hypothetical protein